MKLIIANGHIISPTEERFCQLIVDGGIISHIGAAEHELSPVIADEPTAMVVDAQDCWVTPGLIDLQVNGGAACDFWGDPQPAQVASLALQLARAGVTTILPTLITDELQHLRHNIDFLEQYVTVPEQTPAVSPGLAVPAQQVARKIGSGGTCLEERLLPVRMPGIHLEGPCLSPQKPGVHPSQYLQPLTIDILQRLVTTSVKLITLAPELDASGVALKWLQERDVKVALGHSNATFAEAERSFNQGVGLMTHTFNALPAIHHRAPGAVTAALLDERVSCCLICDGQHILPTIAKLALKMKGMDKTILVTDVAHIGTGEGGLVGSSILLSDAVRNVVAWGLCSFQEAIAMSTINPARAMNWHQQLGHLAAGKLADIVVWSKKTLQVKHVIVRGQMLF